MRDPMHAKTNQDLRLQPHLKVYGFIPTRGNLNTSIGTLNHAIHYFWPWITTKDFHSKSLQRFSVK